MITEILLNQKKELQKINFHKYIEREKLKDAKELLQNNLIKVVMGPRRAGKSVFCLLLLKGKDFAYVNFDEEKLLKVDDTDELIKGIFEVYKKPKFIFFDEIQNLKNWELLVNKLHRQGFNLIITGSNANLLSKELATVLTGRYVAFEILPFSFTEFLKARGLNYSEKEIISPQVKGEMLNSLTEYIRQGGFPEVVIHGYDPKQYLTTLFDAVLLKDIVKRYNIRFSQKIYDLSVYLASNFSSEFSFTKLKNILGFSSTHTVQNYLSYLNEAYIAFYLNRYSKKIKEQINAPKKFYLSDNGFIEAKSFQMSKNLGHLIENIVLVELVNKGLKPNQDLFYYKTRNQKEIDFVIRKGIKINELIQVCYGLSDADTKKREINSLLEASEELKCNKLSIITWDMEKKVSKFNKRIKFIPLWKWLLNI